MVNNKMGKGKNLVGMLGKTAIVVGALVGSRGYVGGEEAVKPLVVEDYSEVSQRVVPKVEGYTLERFKRLLGERLIPEREEELEKLWESEKSNLIHFMSFYEKEFKHVFANEEIREGYESFDPTSLSKKELDFCQKQIPWRIVPDNKEFDEKDKFMIYSLSLFYDSDKPLPLPLKNW